MLLRFRNKRNIIFALIILLILLSSVVGGSIFLLRNQITHQTQTSSTATHFIHQTQTSSTATHYPTFEGIYQFSAHNSSANVNKSYLAGTFLGYYWSQLEPQKGQYRWDLIDQDMKPWIDKGKHVILRVSTAGWTHWSSFAGHGTPQWVYSLGVSSVTEIDGSVLPQYWSLSFLQNLSDFIHAFAMRYDGNSHIAFIEIGVGIGGETKVDSHKENSQMLQLWQSIGYSDPIWWDTVKQIIDIYVASFHITPLAVMPDATFIGKTRGYHEQLVLDYAVEHKLWLQDNGLYAKRTLSPIWMTVPHIEEQVAPTKQTGDSLLSELQTALNLGASYILVFSSDINNPANQSALTWIASQVHH